MAPRPERPRHRSGASARVLPPDVDRTPLSPILTRSQFVSVLPVVTAARAISLLWPQAAAQDLPTRFAKGGTPMKSRIRVLKSSLAACAILVGGIAWAIPVQAQTAYSGRAFAAFVNTFLTGPTHITDTGELPPSGGFKSDALLDTRDLHLAPLDSALTAEVLAASTSGASGVAESSASLANVRVLPGTSTQVTASFVGARTEATCAGVQGSTEIADLTIPGVATLIINEQTIVSRGTYQEIRVNAIHLMVEPGIVVGPDIVGPAEVILSSAKSDINCGVTTQPGPCHDFVTGGGWISVGNSRANFGFSAGFKGGSTTPDVHLNYIDHNSGRKVKATSITVYVVGRDRKSVV